jgi:hypothetical protein
MFVDGAYKGGGTLVDRNWVLTVAHNFEYPDTPGRQSVRFGAVDDHHDDDEPASRVIDRIVPHPTRADVALAHFRDPVPESTWIPPRWPPRPPRRPARHPHRHLRPHPAPPRLDRMRQNLRPPCTITFRLQKFNAA